MKKEKAIKIYNLIKSGDIERVKEKIILDKSLLDFVTPFGTWLHVATRTGKLDMMTSNMLPTVLTIISCLRKTVKHVSIHRKLYNGRN